MKLDKLFDAKAQMNSFSLMCANAIEPMRTAAYDLMQRLKLAARPDSIGQFIYYSQKGKLD